MDPTQAAAQTAAWLDEHDISWVKTEGISIDGLVIGKHLSTRKFVSALPLGNAITEFVIGYDIGGTPFLVWWDDWRRDALGDFHQRPDLSTLVAAPDRPGTANVICDIVDLEGNPIPVCPRSKLRSITERLDGHGLTAKAAFEIEVMLYRESYEEARAKHLQNLTPMAHPSPLGYLHYNSRQQLQFLDVVLQRLDGLGIPIEGWHDEAGARTVRAQPRPGRPDHCLRPRDPHQAGAARSRTRARLLGDVHGQAKPRVRQRVARASLARPRWQPGVLRARWARVVGSHAALDRRSDGHHAGGDIDLLPQHQLVSTDGRLCRRADGRLVG